MSVNYQPLTHHGQEYHHIINLQLNGKLTKEDYDQFVPKLESLMDQGQKISLLVELKDMDGFTIGAAWEDTKFGVSHFRDMHRIAICGNKKWEKVMTYIAKPFTMAQIQYFDASERDRAAEWIISK